MPVDAAPLTFSGTDDYHIDEPGLFLISLKELVWAKIYPNGISLRTMVPMVDPEDATRQLKHANGKTRLRPDKNVYVSGVGGLKLHEVMTEWSEAYAKAQAAVNQ